jgi:hypothetical protein
MQHDMSCSIFGNKALYSTMLCLADSWADRSTADYEWSMRKMSELLKQTTDAFAWTTDIQIQNIVLHSDIACSSYSTVSAKYTPGPIYVSCDIYCDMYIDFVGYNPDTRVELNVYKP